MRSVDVGHRPDIAAYVAAVVIFPQDSRSGLVRLQNDGQGAGRCSCLKRPQRAGHPQGSRPLDIDDPHMLNASARRGIRRAGVRQHFAKATAGARLDREIGGIVGERMLARSTTFAGDSSAAPRLWRDRTGTSRPSCITKPVSVTIPAPRRQADLSARERARQRLPAGASSSCPFACAPVHAIRAR